MACAQTRTFKYNWQINDGTLIINFANNREFPEYGTSRAGKGVFMTNCRQLYLDFMDVLLKHGNPYDTESVYYHFEGLEIYTGIYEGFIILIDNNDFSSGNVWKLSKPDALILAEQLSLPIWVAMVSECPEIICCSNKK